MAQQVCVVLSAADREQLATIETDRNRPRKHVERAHIMPPLADRQSTQRVAKNISVSRPAGFPLPLHQAGDHEWANPGNSPGPVGR